MASHNPCAEELLNEGGEVVATAFAQPIGGRVPNKDVDVVAASSHKPCAEKLHKEGGGGLAYHVRKVLLNKVNVDVGNGLAQPCAEGASQQSQ